MEEILASEAGLTDACLDSFRKFPVVMLQFPEVFALMAPPTREGVDALNRIKNRLPEKFYSSLIGNSSNFFKLSEELPDYLPPTQMENLFTGSLVRIQISAHKQNTALCCSGTHQGLLYSQGDFRDLFTALEKAFLPIADTGFFFGKNYSAAICTSANISGHPDGSITDLAIARAFAENAGIPLLVRYEGEKISDEKGSYPVLIPTNSGVLIEREGPGLDEIIRRFPEGRIIQKNQA